MEVQDSQICNINPLQLKNIIDDNLRKIRLIDCRSFLEYNDNHIVGAVNVCCSKLIKRRLQQEKIALKDLLFHCRIDAEGTTDVIVYDQRSSTADDVPLDSFIYVLLKKLVLVFERVYHLSGGFMGFHDAYPQLCENKIWKFPGLSALSQPCLPTAAIGPTRILPFLYLGSEEDANNKDLLQTHNITYELNVSNKCPKPDFISEGRFMRVPVNDSHNEKLSSFFNQTFQFIEKVRGSNDSLLVHCLAGISRSPTVAIAYVMRHLQMTCEDAYRYVKSKRATISPNFNFLGQLLEYERQLVAEKVIQKLPPAQAQSSSATPGPDYLFSNPPVISPPPSTSTGKRFNLSLRLCPFSPPTVLTSPKDLSPTTAMARLQFDKPLGKENRTGSSNNTSPTSANPPSSPGIGFNLARPTRLVKDANISCLQESETGSWESTTKTVMKQSLSISFSKGFRNRKSSLDQYQQHFESSGSQSGEDDNSYTSKKKCRIHKIIVEGENVIGNEEGIDNSSGCELGATGSSRHVSSNSFVGREGTMNSPGFLSSPMEQYKRQFARSDSVSTSGIGSEISDHDLLTSGSWEMSETGNNPDDGVFSESYGAFLKSPKSSRQLQLWSSDSGHWSADDGLAASTSCSSSTTDVPSTPWCTSSTTGALPEGKSPEKRKHSFLRHSVKSPRAPNMSSDKRRSYAEAASGEWFCCDSSRPKRWSLVETLPDNTAASDNTSGSGVTISTKLKPAEDYEDTSAESDEKDWTAGGNKDSHLDFGEQWLKILSQKEMNFDDRGCGLLYRAHSCPGIVDYCGVMAGLPGDVPEFSADEQLEPLSDSILIKIRSCRNRRKHESALRHSVPNCSCFGNRFSCGSIDYDELLSELQRVHNRRENSNQSSSSTLSSNSFSITVQ